MKEKHSKVPWYSSEIRGPSAPATETEPVPIPPVAPVIVLEDEPPPGGYPPLCGSTVS